VKFNSIVEEFHKTNNYDVDNFKIEFTDETFQEFKKFIEFGNYIIGFPTVLYELLKLYKKDSVKKYISKILDTLINANYEKQNINYFEATSKMYNKLLQMTSTVYGIDHETKKPVEMEKARNIVLAMIQDSYKNYLKMLCEYDIFPETLMDENNFDEDEFGEPYFRYIMQEEPLLVASKIITNTEDVLQQIDCGKLRQTIINIKQKYANEEKENHTDQVDQVGGMIPEALFNISSYTKQKGGAPDDKKRSDKDDKNKKDPKDSKDSKEDKPNTLSNREAKNYDEIRDKLDKWIDFYKDAIKKVDNNNINWDQAQDEYKNLIKIIKFQNKKNDNNTNKEDSIVEKNQNIIDKNYTKVTEITKISYKDNLRSTAIDSEDRLHNSKIEGTINEYKGEINKHLNNIKASLDNFKDLNNYTVQKELYDKLKTQNNEIKDSVKDKLSKYLSDTNIDELKEKIRECNNDIENILNNLNSSNKNFKLTDIDNYINDIKRKILDNLSSFSKSKQEKLQENLDIIKDNQEKFKPKEKEEIIENINTIKKNIEYIIEILTKVNDQVKKLSRTTINKAADVNEIDNQLTTDSLYGRIWKNYLNDIKDPDKILEETQDKLYQSYKSNNLDPNKALALSGDDRVIFIIIIFVIRQICLAIIEALIDNGNITTLYLALIAYVGFYALILFIIIIIVNLDDYKLRIVLNYFNMHINQFGLMLHVFTIIGIMAIIYTLINNINKDVDIYKASITEIERMRLIYKLELITILVFAATAGVSLFA
jgi:hypothetical protein